jgi:hypothetical protein|nr:hypothetical protein [Kofleriaceae bacterium]
MTRGALLAIAIVAALAGRAAADPRVDLDRCTTFDALVLARAIDREIPTIANPTNHGFAIIVECPTTTGVMLRVEPTPASGAIERQLDLGEVPRELQLKLLAVAVGELYAVAAASTPPSAPPAIATAQPGIGATTGVAGANHVLATPDAARTARAAPERVATASTDADAVDHIDHVAARPEPRVPPPAFAIAPHAGVRVYTRTPRPLLELGAEITSGRARVGLRGAIGQTSDALGTVRPWLATLAAGYELLCTRGRAACTVARVEGGVAGATAAVATTNVVARDAAVPYGQATLAGELAHRFGGVAAVASLEAGWAEGLVARSNNHDRAALAGVVAIACLGARW